MAGPLNLAPDALAPGLHAAIERLGEIGPPGIDALLAYLGDHPASHEFDAGFDLLFGWLPAAEDASRES